MGPGGGLGVTPAPPLVSCAGALVLMAGRCRRLLGCVSSSGSSVPSLILYYILICVVEELRVGCGGLLPKPDLNWYYTKS